MNSSCELVTVITAIAIMMSENRSCDELELIAAIFMQLADTLITITTYDSICCKDDSSSKNDNNGLPVVSNS